MISLSLCPVKKVVARYEQIAGTKINFDKSKSLRLGAWRVAFLCQGLSVGITCPSASLEYGSGLASNWSKISWKYRPDGYLASKAVVLKGQGRGVCCVHLPHNPLPFFRTSSA